MIKPLFGILILATVVVTGCANYNIGSQNESAPNGSYAGETLNSPSPTRIPIPAAIPPIPPPSPTRQGTRPPR